MFSSITLALVVSVLLFIVPSLTANQESIIFGAYYKNVDCNTVLNSVYSCTNTTEDIVSGSYLRICRCCANEPVVCCILQRISYVQRDAHGSSWSTSEIVRSVSWEQTWSSSGRYPADGVSADSQGQPVGSFGRYPTDARNPLGSTASPIQEQRRSTSGRNPVVTRWPTWSPLESVLIGSQGRPLSSSGRNPADARKFTWSPWGSVAFNTHGKLWTLSGREPTNTRDSSWSPYERVPQWPLWIPPERVLKKTSGREPTDAKKLTLPENFPPVAGEQPAIPLQSRNEQFSVPKTKTQKTSAISFAYRPPPPIPGIKNTISVQKCQEYGQLCSIIRDYVAGGRQAGPREFPHMALIGFGPENDKSWQCAGSIISRRYILSAAHCTYPGDIVGYARWARLGDLDYTTSTDGTQPKDYIIIERTNHPGYQPPQLYNDIALYKVDREIVFSDFIQPTCLQSEFSISDRVGKVAGWGRTEFVGPTSNHLLYTNISFVNAEDCKDNLDNRLFKQTFPDGVVTSSIVCAGDDDGIRDTCQGDSGGPLFISQKDPWPNCLYRQVGITSTGLPCAQKNSPGLYTRVSNYVPWIESIVWAHDP